MRALVACVVENSHKWYSEAINFALSVRRFGGQLSDAQIVVCFVEGVEPAYEQGLARLDAEVRVVSRFDPRNPPSNKLRMLELTDAYDFDVLLMIDSDTVVIGDLTPYLPTDTVAAEPENHDPYPAGCWEAVYDDLGIRRPSRSMVTTSEGQLTFPYFNSGVLFVPRSACTPLLKQWSERVFDVLDLYERRPDIVPKPERHWTNQLSLAVALAAGGAPVQHLPVALNLSTTVTVHPLFRHEITPPFILHYHNEIDANGFIFRSRNSVLNGLLDQVNRARAEFDGVDYSGLPEPPLARRSLRHVEGTSWYRSDLVTQVRRRSVLAPIKRKVRAWSAGSH